MKTQISKAIKFGRDGDAQDFQAYGWSHPEDGFTWTDGPVAGLVFPAPEAPYGLFIELFFWVNGGTNGAGTQRIIASVNGRPAGTATANGRMRLAFRCARLPPADSRIVINLDLPDAARPTHGKDPRMLGLAVMSLRIMPLLETAQIPDKRTCPSILANDKKTAAELAERQTGLTVAELAMKIESLGVNCEPGFFQRKCGIEPLSLLRFSGVVLYNLTRSIDDGFADLGEKASIDPVPDEADLKDWIIYERRHSLRYHTWVKIGDASIEDMKKREAKRLPFLRNKLLDDLEEGKKIFVHMQSRTLLDAEIWPLFLAIRRRGPGALLVIGPSDPEHPPGVVEEIAPGLMRGYFSHFSQANIGKDLSMPQWLAVCTGAWNLRNNIAAPLTKAS